MHASLHGYKILFNYVTLSFKSPEEEDRGIFIAFGSWRNYSTEQGDDLLSSTSRLGPKWVPESEPQAHRPVVSVLRHMLPAQPHLHARRSRWTVGSWPSIAVVLTPYPFLLE
ncbi:hypothetical protein H1C71_035154 [Ictidomys tridecemlineatus]|nr:hypothetical protein H1C71_035154 [Ictidomys tridecemlineatus]